MPDHLQESERLSELYRLYGIAAHNCANIEYRMAFLLLGPKWAILEDLEPEKIREVYEQLYLKPLGTLLQTFKSHYDVSEEAQNVWTNVLEKRNYLIHRFFGEYGKKMHHEETIEKMISELTELVFFFQEVSRQLDQEK